MSRKPQGFCVSMHDAQDKEHVVLPRRPDQSSPELLARLSIAKVMEFTSQSLRSACTAATHCRLGCSKSVECKCCMVFHLLCTVMFGSCSGFCTAVWPNVHALLFFCM